MRVPAPPRLSTTTCCPSTAVMRSATSRAAVSVIAPGAYGTTRRIGLSGKLLPCACAGRDTATRVATALAIARRREVRAVMVVSGLFSVLKGSGLQQQLADDGAAVEQFMGAACFAQRHPLVD